LTKLFSSLRRHRIVSQLIKEIKEYVSKTVTYSTEQIRDVRLGASGYHSVLSITH
jgi:hypothetical protein